MTREDVTDIIEADSETVLPRESTRKRRDLTCLPV